MVPADLFSLVQPKCTKLYFRESAALLQSVIFFTSVHKLFLSSHLYCLHIEPNAIQKVKYFSRGLLTPRFFSPYFYLELQNVMLLCPDKHTRGVSTCRAFHLAIQSVLIAIPVKDHADCYIWLTYVWCRTFSENLLRSL